MIQHNSRAKDVELILDQLNILYEQEKTFDDLKYKNKLRFDFYIPKYNLCIEFNGAQHYEYIEHFHKDEDAFKEQLFKDYLKREYCQAHSVHLIELPCSLTSDEIRAELVQFINEHGDEEIELLPEIESFLKLNESHTVYINQLYAEYKRMLNDLNIHNISSYKMFYDYVIDYWDLKNKSIMKDQKGKYVECWINENVMNDDNETKDELLKQSDSVYQFVQHVINNDDVLSNKMLPMNHLNRSYIEYMNQTHPQSKKVSSKILNSRLNEYMLEFNYIYYSYNVS